MDPALIVEVLTLVGLGILLAARPRVALQLLKRVQGGTERSPERKPDDTSLKQ